LQVESLSRYDENLLSSLKNVTVSINEQIQYLSSIKQLEDHGQELKLRACRVSSFVRKDTWVITDAIESRAAALAILRKQPKELKIIFQDDGAEPSIIMDALSRIFKRAKVPIDVTVKCLDSFYNKNIDGLQRDTEILSTCLSRDK